jgi:hypothetical protein
LVQLPEASAVDWENWNSGDSVGVPDDTGVAVEQAEVLRRVAVGFRRVCIDWTEGDRWAEARIAKATEFGYTGILLEAEHSLRGRSVLVSVADDPGPDAVWVRFYITPEDDGMELNYLPAAAVPAGRVLAVKLAELLGYKFFPWEESEDTELDDAPDPDT